MKAGQLVNEEILLHLSAYTKNVLPPNFNLCSRIFQITKNLAQLKNEKPIRSTDLRNRQASFFPGFFR